MHVAWSEACEKLARGLKFGPVQKAGARPPERWPLSSVDDKGRAAPEKGHTYTKALGGGGSSWVEVRGRELAVVIISFR